MKAFVNGSLLAMILSSAAWAFGASPEGARNPVGEHADYQLDHDSNRTSSLVKSGSLSAAVADQNTDGANYDMQVNYDFKIQIFGDKSGTRMVAVPNAYFTPEFMVQLRQTGHYESPKFKIDYEGATDATTMDGHSYPGCDKVRIYDIDDTASLPLADIAAQLLGGSSQADIQDLEIHAAIYPGVPVLGAVKLDVSGKYDGIGIKAGGDYQAP